jgi:hypothetical protein
MRNGENAAEITPISIVRNSVEHGDDLSKPDDGE